MDELRQVGKLSLQHTLNRRFCHDKEVFRNSFAPKVWLSINKQVSVVSRYLRFFNVLCKVVGDRYLDATVKNRVNVADSEGFDEVDSIVHVLGVDPCLEVRVDLEDVYFHVVCFCIQLEVVLADSERHFGRKLTFHDQCIDCVFERIHDVNVNLEFKKRGALIDGHLRFEFTAWG